jgi:hypothetical protein
MRDKNQESRKRCMNAWLHECEKIPNYKHQITKLVPRFVRDKLQIPMTKITNKKCSYISKCGDKFWNLRFVICDFPAKERRTSFVIWCLGFY